MRIEVYGTHVVPYCYDGQTEAGEIIRKPRPKVVVSSPLGFPGMVIYFEEIPFPESLDGCLSYVGHPSTRALVEALGAVTDTSNGGAPGRYAGPEVGESYLAVPLATNQRPGGVTAEQTIEDVRQLKAILCLRIA
jgi:hypothetical protein